MARATRPASWAKLPVAPDTSTVLRLGAFVRLPLLLLCLALDALSGERTPGAITAGLLTMTAVAAMLLPSAGRLGELIRIVEAVMWAVVVSATGTVNSPHLAYLLAPALVGGLVEGVRAAVLVPGTATAGLLVVRAVAPGDVSLRDFSATAAQWVALAIAAGMVGAWTRRLQASPADDLVQVQQAAHRLLVQLRTIARRLPGSLDPATTAEALLHDLRSLLPVDQAWVLVRSSGGDRLVPLASIGAEALAWDVSLGADSVLAEAWVTQQPAVRRGGHRRPNGRTAGGTALALPLVVGPSVFGIVALQTSRRDAYAPAMISEAADCVQRVALALDTGLLFDELRASATAEERLRLSREIHDGIAQELVSVGYALDGIAADAPQGLLRKDVVAVRQEVTRLVTELRLSLFDLRSGVDLHAGLGAAISEQVRRVGASSDLTVHLSLSEGPLRLSPDAEAELLRIAQEAIANARKHSGASNLWVTCEIDPPHGLLVIEDDGCGLLSSPRLGSHGLAIMAERAARVHAELQIGPRASGNGTRVSVSLGSVRATRKG